MNDSELNKRFDDIEQLIGSLADAMAEQRRFQVEVLAHHMALHTSLRNFLSKHGEDKTMLDHRILSTYERAKKIVLAQAAPDQQSGAETPSRDIPPILPDEETNS